MVPQMVFEVIYPQSMSVLVEPCRGQNLACGSYVKLQQLRSSSVFTVYLAIGRFAVDNETAATTIMTMITGVDSAVFDGVRISKRACAWRRMHERILIFGNCLTNLCLAGSHSFPYSGFLIEQQQTAHGDNARASMAFRP